MQNDDRLKVSSLKRIIEDVTSDYSEKVSGARRRLTNALEIIIIAYYASLIKRYSDGRLDELMNV